MVGKGRELMEPSTTEPELAPPTLPDMAATFRHLDPAAALAFRTPLQEHPPAADTKAAALLTGLGIMLTLVAKYGDTLGVIFRGRNEERFLLVALLFGFGGTGLAAIVQSFRTIFPRFPAVPPSLAFWGDIAKLSRDEYLDRVGSIGHDEALTQILIYNHTLATICVEKFSHLNRGVRLFRWAFGCWLTLMILLNVKVLF